jgi:hypothetical protein
LAVVLAVLLLVGGCWHLTAPLKAPHAREQAKLGERDPLWRHVPPGQIQTSRSTSLPDARWIPWAIGGDYGSVVVRAYGPVPEPGAALDAWRQAAISSGWTPASRVCRYGRQHDTYTARRGRWPAVLRIDTGYAANELVIRIYLAASPQNVPTDSGGFTQETHPGPCSHGR